MARIVGRLSSRQVANARPKKGKQWAVIPDGGNPYLQCTIGKEGNVRRSWLFKYEFQGKRHEIGLGPLHTVGLGDAELRTKNRQTGLRDFLQSKGIEGADLDQACKLAGAGSGAALGLADARAKARELRQQLRADIDPLEARQKARQALLAERARMVTFKQVAEDYLKLHLDSFKNPKHRQQWQNTLAQYAFPKIGHMTVADIGPADVLRVIEPIWTTKRETASRVRQRVERILDYATTREFRSGDNPAARVAEALPKRGNGKGHHAALPYAELPAFMAELRAHDSPVLGPWSSLS